MDYCGNIPSNMADGCGKRLMTEEEIRIQKMAFENAKKATCGAQRAVPQKPMDDYAERIERQTAQSLELASLIRSKLIGPEIQATEPNGGYSCNGGYLDRLRVASLAGGELLDMLQSIMELI